MSPIFLRDAVYYKSTTQIVKTFTHVFCVYTEVMGQDDTVTFE